jgi:hypothetical protein
MSDNIDKPSAEDPRPNPPSGKAEGKQADGAPTGGGPGVDPTEALKKNLEQTRLPPDVKAQILAQLPPPEERARLLQELLDGGGLSSEEFLTSLGLEAERQP